MYHAFWRLSKFLTDHDFGGPSGQALPLPSRVVSPSRALVLSCAHYFQAPATQATVKWPIELGSEEFRVNK